MCHHNLDPNGTNTLDVFHKLATIAIAVFNLFYAIWVFRLKDKKDGEEKERDRKIQLLKTLVLDHNLAKFYNIFDDIKKVLEKLKVAGLTIEDKQKIDAELADKFVELRRDFYDVLLAVDLGLYNSIKEKSDVLQSYFSSSIFDEGIVLSHPAKYEQVIDEKYTSAKTDIIKYLFQFR